MSRDHFDHCIFECIVYRNQLTTRLKNCFTVTFSGERSSFKMSTRTQTETETEIQNGVGTKSSFKPLFNNSNVDRSKDSKKNEYKWDIVWINVLLLGFIHLGAIYGFYLRFTLGYKSELFGKLYGIASALGVTAGAHRLWSHRCYKANKFLEILLMLMMSTTYQNSIYTWCRDHRLHHKHSETDADPHNAKRGFFFSHMGWLFLRKHPDVIEKGKYLDMSDLKANPIVMFQHKYYYFIVIIFTVLIPILIPWYFFGESLKHCFFTVTLYRYVFSLHSTWGINSIAHLYGNKPYNKDIGPTENRIMMVAAWGEGFHNYHHSYPWDYKAAEYGDDCRNITTYLIDFFAWLGWATDLKTAPKRMIDSKVEKTGDGSREEQCPSVFGFLRSTFNQKQLSLKRWGVFLVYIYFL